MKNWVFKILQMANDEEDLFEERIWDKDNDC